MSRHEKNLVAHRCFLLQCNWEISAFPLPCGRLGQIETKHYQEKRKKKKKPTPFRDWEGGRAGGDLRLVDTATTAGNQLKFLQGNITRSDDERVKEKENWDQVGWRRMRRCCSDWNIAQPDAVVPPDREIRE